MYSVLKDLGELIGILFLLLVMALGVVAAVLVLGVWLFQDYML